MTFIIDGNDILGYSAMVTIFFIDNDYEIEFGKGYISNIQSEFFHVQLVDISDEFALHYGQALIGISNYDNVFLRNLVLCTFNYET